jgi:hypothetical protein
MNYFETNLIKYEDAIRLHFDDTGGTAWLTLQNYGFVLGGRCDAVETIIIGQAHMGYFQPEYIPTSVGYINPNADWRSISISKLLDAIDVIRFQLVIIDICKKRQDKVVFRENADDNPDCKSDMTLSRAGLVERIMEALRRLKWLDESSNELKNPFNTRTEISSRLRGILEGRDVQIIRDVFINLHRQQNLWVNASGS